MNNYAEEYITKAIAQEVVKNVFRIDTITQEVIDTCMKCMVAIKNAPPADVRENIRGEWIRWYEEIKHDNYTEYIPHCKCPKCGTEYDSHTVKFLNYCPNCGADMRGEV